MEFGRELQHLGKHIASQMTDCHDGNPSQQICADKAADASNDDQKNKKYRHNPDFIPVILESMEFPDPVIEIAIEPKTKAGQEKMGIALAKLAKKDPTFKTYTNEDTG